MESQTTFIDVPADTDLPHTLGVALPEGTFRGDDEPPPPPPIDLPPGTFHAA